MTFLEKAINIKEKAIQEINELFKKEIMPAFKKEVKELLIKIGATEFEYYEGMGTFVAKALHPCGEIDFTEEKICFRTSQPMELFKGLILDFTEGDEMHGFDYYYILDSKTYFSENVYATLTGSFWGDLGDLEIGNFTIKL